MSYYAYTKEDLPEYVKGIRRDMELWRSGFGVGVDEQSILDFLNFIYDNDGVKIGGR